MTPRGQTAPTGGDVTGTDQSPVILASVAMREALALARVSDETLTDPTGASSAVLDEVERQLVVMQDPVAELQARSEDEPWGTLRPEFTVMRSRLTRLHVATSLVEAAIHARASALRDQIQTYQAALAAVEHALADGQHPMSGVSWAYPATSTSA